MNKIEKIKTEIDRLQSSMLDENSNFKSQYDQGIFDGLSLLENFIDSLEQPIKRTPADIEAAMQEVEEKSKLFTEAHKDDVISNNTIDYLEEAACEYDNSHIDDNNLAFKAGAQWQKERILNNAIEREVKVDAGGYPYIDVTELYDYDKDKPLAKEGDKVKLIIIMEE